MKKFSDIESLATICTAETLVILAVMAGFVDAPQKYPMAWPNLIAINCIFCAARTIVAEHVANKLFAKKQTDKLIAVPLLSGAITFIPWFAITFGVGAPSAFVAMCFGLLTLVVTGQVALEIRKSQP